MSCHIRTVTPLKTLALVTNAIRSKHGLYHTTIQVEGVNDKGENKHAFICDNDVHDVKVIEGLGKGSHSHSH